MRSYGAQAQGCNSVLHHDALLPSGREPLFEYWQPYVRRARSAPWSYHTVHGDDFIDCSDFHLTGQFECVHTLRPGVVN